jgi:Tfp pilus assembly protein PilN
MIQFNLLPDVKVEFIKARRSKRMVLLVATGVTAFSLTIFIGLFLVVNVLQTKHISDLNNDIKKDTAALKAIPNLDKILTVQNQLASLTQLHEQKPYTSRLIDYLAKLTPAEATISSTKLDFPGGNTLTISGNANALSTVNKYVDTLKFTTYTTNDQPEAKTAFSNVVLTSFGAGEKTVTYQISAVFDPTIFDGTKQVTLVVPKIISTRSETEKPGDLFQQTNTVKQ